MLAVRVDRPFDPRPRIEACAYYPHAAEASWPQAFADFARDLSADGLPVVVSVNSQLASLLQLSLPDVPEAELASALKFRAREISPLPVDDMVLDYVEVPGIRARGRERIGYCAVARLSQMRALRDAIKASGMALTAIDINDMVLHYLLARFQPGEENSALLFMGAQESRVIVARSDRLYLFRISNIGAHHFAEGTNLDLGRVEGLVLEIQRTLDFYDSHFTDPPPRQIWLAPEWPFIPHLTRQLGDQLRLPVHEIVLAEAFEGTQRLSGQPVDLACLALGAVLRPHDERAGR
ncbi:MAG: hypothetical protein P3W87_004445 [Gammaproteobacteria bacterium]|nr:hypothetical protein [Gammaproteobacteria bacterium]